MKGFFPKFNPNFPYLDNIHLYFKQNKGYL